MFYTLKLKDLVLAVHLGCGEAERAKPQEVRISVEFRFREFLASVKTDNLEDTVCYAETSSAIRQHCEKREFKLIERLGYEIYQVVCRTASKGGPLEIGVSVHKVHPPVEKLEGGSWFSCGDFQL